MSKRKPSRKTIALTFHRNTDQVVNEIRSRQATIASDSMLGSGNNSARLIGGTVSLANSDKLNVTLTWEMRPEWKMQIQDCIANNTLAFSVYGTTPQKYWLKRLIRRCR